VTTDGTTFGTTVPNAGAIAWLLTNRGPTASSVDQQGALQAAIWRMEYGSTGFQLDGADNSNDPGYNDLNLIADDQADIAALGSQTAPVGRCRLDQSVGEGKRLRRPGLGGPGGRRRRTSHAADYARTLL
jgi:hypothetical protein